MKITTQQKIFMLLLPGRREFNVNDCSMKSGFYKNFIDVYKLFSVGSGGSSEICVEQSPSGTPEHSSLETSREPLSDFIGPLFSSSGRGPKEFKH